MDSKKVRVGIRGVAGLLGSRIASAITRTSDMEVTVGVVVPDKTLDALLHRCQMVPGYASRLPKRLFVQCPARMGREAEVVRRLNSEQNIFTFEGASQLSWRKECDVIIDTAYPAGKEGGVTQQYQTFPGPVIVQSGAFPEGRLIAPPCITPNTKGDHLYRMSDCLLSGMMPLLHPFERARHAHINVLTQFDGRESDYLITERAHALYIREDVRERAEGELASLFPERGIRVSNVVQIPSLLHYQMTIELKLARAVTHDRMREMLASVPHVRLLPEAVTSTYDVNLARSFTDAIPPVMVFTHALSPKPKFRSSTVRIVAALYYRTAAVLPNLDAIRILGQRMEPLAAMRQTDRDMGFTE